MQIISVIMPVYNSHDTLEASVASLIAQSLQNWELLLVDDGSTDGSSEICDRLAERDQRIRVFHKKNGGVSSARNVGLNAALGNMVMFLDSDDWYDSDALQNASEAMEETGADIVTFPFHVESDWSGRDAVSGGKRNCNKRIIEGTAMWGEILCSKDVTGCLCNKMFSRALLKSPLCESYHICEDFVFTAEALTSAVKMACLDTPMYHYYRAVHGSRAYRTYKLTAKDISAIAAYQALEKMYSQYAPEYLHIVRKNLLKRFLNYRARYLLNHMKDKELKRVISDGLKDYWKLVTCDRRLSWTTRGNLYLTRAFPRLMLTAKAVFLERHKEGGI